MGSLTLRIDGMLRALKSLSGASTPRTERPRAERHYIHKTAIVQLASGELIQVYIKNLSASGTSIEFRGPALSEKVLITERALKLHRWAKVIWQSAGGAGLQFVADESVRVAPASNGPSAANTTMATPSIRAQKPRQFG